MNIKLPFSFIMKKKKQQWQWIRNRKSKRIFTIARWLHVYSSSAFFGLLIFFCLTGIILNHPEWEIGERQDGVETHELSGQLANRLRENPSANLEPLQAHLGKTLGIFNPKEINVDLEMNEITLDYPVPAGFGFVTVFIEHGYYELEFQQGSFLMLLNDLHKGRHSGDVWGTLIDVSAVVMIVFALTGSFVLLQNPKYRSKGGWFLLLGLLTPVGIYLIWVPVI